MDKVGPDKVQKFPRWGDAVPRAPLACFRFSMAAPVLASVQDRRAQREMKRMRERKSATAAEGPAHRYQSGASVAALKKRSLQSAKAPVPASVLLQCIEKLR